MRKIICAAALTSALSITAATPAVATTTVYLSQASFDAALTSTTTAATQYAITNPTTYCYDHNVTCVESSGVTFSVNRDSGLYYLPAGSQGNLTNVISLQGGAVSRATVTGFGNAIGFSFNSYFDRITTGVIFSGAGFAKLLAVPFRTLDTNFFGVISDGPIGPIQVTSDAQTFDFVSYTLQTAVVPPPPPPPPPAAVPEPAGWTMFIGGFGAICGAMRRRQNVRVALS